MEYTRIELRLAGARFESHVTVRGAVDGRVFGAVIDPASQCVLGTQVPGRQSRERHLETASDVTGVVVTSDTQVMLNKHRLGKVSRLWVERADGHVTHVLIGAGGSVEHVASIDQIDQLGAKQIDLKPAIGDLRMLPVYRDDAAIASDVARALADALLDPRALRAVHARIEDGHVDLTGLVDTEDQFEAVTSAIRRIGGVRGVQIDIIVTELLAAQVASALNAIEEKGSLGDDPQIEVYSEHQIIYLTGTVATAKAAADAERAALGVNGVKIVVNQLTPRQASGGERTDPASPATHNK